MNVANVAEQLLFINSKAAKMKSEYLLAGIGLFSISACATSLELASHRPERQVMVDGDSGEWSEGLTFLQEGVSVGFLNDREYLYACVVISEKKIQRHFMTRGFVVWFDKEGGNDRDIGVRFPVGIMEMGVIYTGEEFRWDEETLREHFQESLVNVEIYRSGIRESQSIRLDELQGVEVSVAFSKDDLVYELKMPLRRDSENPIAIGVSEHSGYLGVGLETGYRPRERIGDYPTQTASPGWGVPNSGTYGGTVYDDYGEGNRREYVDTGKKFKLQTTLALHSPGVSLPGEISRNSN